MSTSKEHVDGLLGQVYTPEGVTIWWNGRNSNLGDQRPIDLWASGQREIVRAEAVLLAGENW